MPEFKVTVTSGYKQIYYVQAEDWEQAEEIAYLFCIIDNPRIENIWNIESDSLRKDLMLLEQANRDEQSEAEMMTWEEAYDV